jgi:uncharacterized membrane protein
MMRCFRLIEKDVRDMTKRLFAIAALVFLVLAAAPMFDGSVLAEPTPTTGDQRKCPPC